METLRGNRPPPVRLRVGPRTVNWKSERLLTNNYKPGRKELRPASSQFSGESGQLPPTAGTVSAKRVKWQLFKEFEEFNASTARLYSKDFSHVVLRLVEAKMLGRLS
jgi:hypothetical protein